MLAYLQGLLRYSYLAVWRLTLNQYNYETSMLSDSSLVNQTTFFGWRLSIGDYKRPTEMVWCNACNFVPRIANLAIVDWCLIATREVSIGTDVIEIMWTWKSRLSRSTPLV